MNQRLKKAAYALWEEKFNEVLTEDTLSIPVPMAPSARPVKRRGAILDAIIQRMEVDTPDTTFIDNLNTFANAPTSQIDCTPLEWLCRKEQRDR